MFINKKKTRRNPTAFYEHFTIHGIKPPINNEVENA